MNVNVDLPYVPIEEGNQTITCPRVQMSNKEKAARLMLTSLLMGSAVFLFSQSSLSKSVKYPAATTLALAGEGAALTPLRLTAQKVKLIILVLSFNAIMSSVDIYFDDNENPAPTICGFVLSAISLIIPRCMRHE